MSGRDFSDKFPPRITMPAEGFVTVVPVDKMGSRKPQTIQSKEPRGGRQGDWGLRDPSPSTARLRSVWCRACGTKIDCDVSYLYSGVRAAAEMSLPSASSPLWLPVRPPSSPPPPPPPPPPRNYPTEIMEEKHILVPHQSSFNPKLNNQSLVLLLLQAPLVAKC